VMWREENGPIQHDAPIVATGLKGDGTAFAYGGTSDLFDDDW
jgi:hypothetical protein